MPNGRPRIGLILGSSTDLRLVKRCQEQLDAFGEPYEMIIASAHRTPEKVRRWSENAQRRGLKAIIAAAGAAAALPGTVAAHTLVPVVGLPLDTTQLRGMDALYAIVQMPPGMPVGTVGINNADNAVLLALSIVANQDPVLRKKLVEYRKQLAIKVEKANEDIYQATPQLRPVEPGPVLEMPAQNAGARAPKAFRRGRVEAAPTEKRIKIDLSAPSPKVIERAMDVLLVGGVIAFPTDTVYGLAADASRPQAVKKLYALKKRDAEKPVAILIHSRRLLSSIAKEMPIEIQDVIDQHWPGALTVILKKYTGSFNAVGKGDTIGVRIPNSRAALSVLAMIGRPLAATSANLSGKKEARDADAVEKMFGDQVDLILDAGPLKKAPPSTVLDASERPFRIVREGAIKRETLAKELGDLLAK